MMRARSFLIPLLLPLLGGCAAPVVLGLGAGAAGIAVATDRRTAGTMLDDESIELQTMDLIARDQQLLENTHVNATSFNGVLLLTGEAASEQLGATIAKRAATLPKVRMVKNELQYGALASSESRTRDSAITTRVKSSIASEIGTAQAHHVKVVTEAGIVYLMGLVSPQEADDAVAVVRRSDGVQRIVKVFEYQH